uniref:2-oxoglutarate dehydrogenase, mitochondrial n=1 Tax=Steinernema glaseri TaxID=37863 RepID=A0A1I8A919_9BILA
MHRASLLARYTLSNRCIQSSFRSKVTNASRPLAINRSQSTSAAVSVTKEPFMNGTSSIYIEQMYESWRSDPSSVHKSWDAYFRNVEAGAAPGQAFQAPPTFVSGASVGAAVGGAVASPAGLSTQAISDHLKVQLLIRSYQTRGHNIADLDPLGINSADLDDTIPPELELGFYGLSEKDLDREFVLPPTTFFAGDEKSLTLREIIRRLKNIYCSHTGIEYMHLTNYEQQEWIRQRFESPHVTELTHDQKKTLFKRLIRSTKFEEFLAKKWPTSYRCFFGQWR